MHLKNRNHRNNRSLILAFKKPRLLNNKLKFDDFPPFTLTDKEIRRIKNKTGKKTGIFAGS